MKSILTPFLILFSTVLFAQNDEATYELAKTDFNLFAHKIAGNASSDLERAQNIVIWFASNFDWKATDYKNRNYMEIIERGGGNCNELAIVSIRCMEELGIQQRKIREINLHVDTPRRQKSAEAKVVEIGNRASVFGQRHNDHVWIEIFDTTTNSWHPADPSMGVVGDKWIKSRFGFGERYSLNPASNDMIAPFAILYFDNDMKLAENRSTFYAVDGFNTIYNGKLASLPSWSKWTKEVEFLSVKAAEAFEGKVNLHNYADEIKSLWETYFQLKKEYELSGSK